MGEHCALHVLNWEMQQSSSARTPGAAVEKARHNKRSDSVKSFRQSPRD
jgi:hypothetical protein